MNGRGRKRDSGGLRSYHAADHPNKLRIQEGTRATQASATQLAFARAVGAVTHAGKAASLWQQAP